MQAAKKNIIETADLVFFSEANRILLQNKTGKMLGEITFPNVGKNTVEIDHTFVDSSLRGQGMAGKLVELAVEQIKSEGKQAIPTCTYNTDQKV